MTLTERCEQGTLRQFINRQKQVRSEKSAFASKPDTLDDSKYSLGGAAGEDRGKGNGVPKWDWAMKICLGRDVARALAYLHERKFIHG